MSGTIAASVPMLVPVMSRVSGTTATMSSTNGALRPMFTIKPSGAFTTAIGFGPVFDVM